MKQERHDFLNTIYYGIAKEIIDKLLDKKLINQKEYYKIDNLNRKSFHQTQ